MVSCYSIWTEKKIISIHIITTVSPCLPNAYIVINDNYSNQLYKKFNISLREWV